MHEVTPGRYASSELLRGRLRGVRQRREPAPLDTTRGPAHGVANGLVWGFLGWSLMLLALAAWGCTSLPAQVEGDLGDLSAVLAADNASEDVLALVGSGQ